MRKVLLILTVLCAAASVYALPEPVAHWTLDEDSGTTAVDISGNGYDAIFGGGETQGIDAVHGKGVQFNNANSDSWMDVPVEVWNDHVEDTQQYTICFWYKIDNATTQNVAFASSPDDNRTLQSHLPWDNGTIYFDHGGRDTTGYAGAGGLTGVWQHWTYQRAPGSAGFKQVLRDSVPIMTNNRTEALAVHNNFTFGANEAHGNNSHGAFDDIRVYDVVLTPAEIQEVMDGGGLGNLPPKITVTPNRLLYWPDIDSIIMNPTITDDDPNDLGEIGVDYGSILWSCSDPNVSFIDNSIASAEVNFAVPGTYQLLIEVTDEALKTASAIATIELLELVLPDQTAKDIPGDLNRSFSVNIEDLVLICEQWLDPYGCIGYEDMCADIYNGEDGVDVQDLAVLAQHWQHTEIPLFINEVLAVNSQTEPGNDGSYDDWIEIYNAGPVDIDMAGMYLTDNDEITTKWQFPTDRPEETTIKSGLYLLIWADNPEMPPAFGLHASFKIDGDGDDIWLFDTDGQTVIDSLEFGEQTTDVSLGPDPDAGDDWVTLSPTPGSSNNGAYLGLVADTKFSVNRGFYSSPFDVTITCQTADATIYYTLDGSLPVNPDGTPTVTAEEYDANNRPQITTTTGLRAVAVKPAWKSSNVDTQTYLFIADIIEQPEMDPNVVYDSLYSEEMDHAFKSIRSLSIVTNPDNLFDSSIGILANTKGRGIEWERPVSIEFIEPNNPKDSFQTNAGLRVHGNGSRNNVKNSLRLLFRDDYGAKKLEYPVFGDDWVAERFNTIVLRAQNANSWTSGRSLDRTSTTFLQDTFAKDTQGAMGHPTGGSTYVHLFLNSTYWGLYNPTERPDGSLGEDHFGGDDTDYDAVNRRFSVEVLSGTKAFWDEMIAYSHTLLDSPEEYEQIAEYIDIDNLIDYMLVHQFMQTRDGPDDFGHNNMRLVRRNNPSGPFRAYAWDMEYSMIDTLGTRDYSYPYPIYSSTRTSNRDIIDSIASVYIRLKDNNPEFQLRYADRAYKHLYHGGALSVEKASDRFLTRADEIMSAVVCESARWGDHRRTVPYTRDVEWMAERNRILDEFLPARPDHVVSQLRIHGLYPSIDPPELNQYGGQVDVGFEVELSADAGSVHYTLDGSDPRLPGGDVNPLATEFFVSDPTTIEEEILVEMSDAQWTYLYDGSDQGTAWRIPDFNDSAWGSGPGQLGFGDDGEVTDIGPEINGQFSSYFRHAFSVTDASSVTDLTIDLVYDDGAVIYINGDEVDRVNMPTGTISYDTPSDDSDGDNATITLTDIDPNFLNEGSNVIAVEVHQASATSSDLSFDLRLTSIKDLGSGGSGDNTTSEILNKSTHIKSRVRSGSTWSALSDAKFSVGPVAENLRITEIMYHPADPNTEFIELQNIGAEAINLNLVHFTDGVDFTFGDMTLAPGGYTVVVQDRGAFEDKYGTGLNIAGQYTGSLDNGGEEIVLRDALGIEIHDFDYEDNWYELTDGIGFSLTMVNPDSTDPNDWDTKTGWRSSLAEGGTPGQAPQATLAADSIVINELLAHSHAAADDWVELRNTTGQPIDIGGWFLSDDDSDPNMIRKYEIPSNTIVPANGYYVFYEDTSFGSLSQPVEKRFGLSEGGETVYLYSGNNGEITGYYQTQQQFDASERDISFGRYEKAELSGGYDFTRMISKTDTTPNTNTGPLIPDIVITEIYYNPVNGTDYEFVELYNRTGSAVTLETEVTTETSPGIFVTEDIPWRIEGTGYEFDAGTTIPAYSYILLAKVPVNYSSAPCTVYGPYDGKLDNGGEELEIQIPGDQEYGEDRYWIPIEKIDYDDTVPWPTSADGFGDSLHRINNSIYGRDYSNWQDQTPSPGS